MFELDTVVVKLHFIGLISLGVFGLTGADVAAIVGGISTGLGGVYWTLKITKEFVKPWIAKRKKQ